MVVAWKLFFFVQSTADVFVWVDGVGLETANDAAVLFFSFVV